MQKIMQWNLSNAERKYVWTSNFYSGKIFLKNKDEIKMFPDENWKDSSTTNAWMYTLKGVH